MQTFSRNSPLTGAKLSKKLIALWKNLICNCNLFSIFHSLFSSVWYNREMENNDPFHILDKEKEIESHRIEELEKKLYSRQNEIPHKDRTMLHPKKTGFRGSESWEEGDNTFSFSKRAEKSNGSPFVKFFIFSVIFLKPLRL